MNYAQPGLFWARQIGSTGTDCANVIALDNSGNVYVTGKFQGNADFDLGPGIFNLTCPGIYSNIFVAKYTSLGNLIWAKSFSGVSNYSGDQGYGIQIDASGNVYTAGVFYGTVDFDPSIGTFTLSNYQSAFLCKLDANGNFVWAKDLGGLTAFSMDLNQNGEPVVAGIFGGTVDFDPGPGVYLLNGGSTHEIFVSKFNTVGNLLWARSFGSPTFLDYCYKVITDEQNNIYFTGFFSSVVDFDPAIANTSYLTATGGIDAYICKLNDSGNLVWAKAFNGVSDVSDSGFGMTLDQNKNLFITGYFNNVVDFNPGPATFTLLSNGDTDVFVCKLDSIGNFVWAKSFGGSGRDMGFGIAFDERESLLVSGIFSNTIDSDPGNSIFTLSSNGNFDAFIELLDPLGNFKCAGAFGATGDDKCLSVAYNTNGEILIAGAFTGNTDFDMNIGVSNMTSSGNSDIFIAQIMDCLILDLNETLFANEELSVFPNPSNGIYNKTFKTNTFTEISIIDVYGRKMKQLTNNELSLNLIDIKELNDGVYFFIGNDGNRTHSIKLIKQ